MPRRKKICSPKDLKSRQNYLRALFLSSNIYLPAIKTVILIQSKTLFFYRGVVFVGARMRVWKKSFHQSIFG